MLNVSIALEDMGCKYIAMVLLLFRKKQVHSFDVLAIFVYLSYSY